MYKSIPSVTSFLKIGEHTWQDTDADGMDSTIYLQSIDWTIDLKKYTGVLNFKEREDRRRPILPCLNGVHYFFTAIHRIATRKYATNICFAVWLYCNFA